MRFESIKLFSSLIVNLSICVLLMSIFDCNKTFIFLSIGLVLGETLFFAHCWKPIESNICINRRDWKNWLICVTAHISYAILAFITFSLVSDILSFNDWLLAFSIGCIIPTFQFLN